MKKINLLFILTALFVMSNMYSQIISKIDVNDEIALGHISVINHTPFDIGSIYDIFDGEFSTLARSAGINPMEITFLFSSPVLLSSAKVLVAQNGRWKLEGANNLEDLNNQEGSYVLLCENLNILENVYDEQDCEEQSIQFLKATIHRTVGDNYVHLRELEFYRSFTISSICLVPKSPKLIIGGKHEMKIIAEDINGSTLAIQDFDLTSSNPNVTVTTFGDKVLIEGNSIGSAFLVTEFMGFTDNSTCNVLNDFELVKSDPVNVDIALVLQNPDVPSQGNQPFNQVFGWNDPVSLANQLANNLSAASDYTMNYNIVQTFDTPYFFTLNNGNYVDIDEFAQALIDNNTSYLEDNIFDYTGMLETLNACELSNEGTIDEIWVYSVPYGGMMESRMAGENAFWINGNIIEGTSCIGLLPVMGFNYEREVAQALHSYGHRAESTLKHLYGRWDYTATDKNDWELFSSYNQVFSNKGHIGNIHFPVNGTSDYDYTNTDYVKSYHTNWKRYPYIFDDLVNINCNEWGCTELGYMTWWFEHIPKYKCVNKDKILNNWWHYIIDFDEAITEASFIDVCTCNSDLAATASIENAFKLSVFPNPVNDILLLQFILEQSKTVKLQITDIMGKIIIQKNIDCVVGQSISYIDMSLLSKGFYFANVIIPNTKIISKKIIKL